MRSRHYKTVLTHYVTLDGLVFAPLSPSTSPFSATLKGLFMGSPQELGGNELSGNENPNLKGRL